MHVLDMFLNHHRSKKKKKKNFTCRFELNSNIIQISIEILIQTTQTFNFRQHYSVKTEYYIYFTIYTVRKGKRIANMKGKNDLASKFYGFEWKEKVNLWRRKKCNIDWILESECMQNQRAHINSFDLLNRLIWMFKFQARSTQFARTLSLFNSFPSTIQTVLASTTTKPGQLAC